MPIIIALEENIRLAEYTKGTIHFTGISTAEGVKVIKKAKKRLSNITADVHISNLIYNENNVLEFDSNYKVMPPLRFESDRIALWEGLKDGTINTIVSDHRPNDTEEKNIEFQEAEFGSLNLQTSFGSLNLVPEFNLSIVINSLTIEPRRILNLKPTTINIGETADLTLFNPKEKWIFKEKDILSKTKNTPLLNKELTGKVIGIINKGKLLVKK